MRHSISSEGLKRTLLCLAALALLAALSGCTGTLYPNDRVEIPGTGMGILSNHIAVALIMLGAFGPVTTIIAIAALWKFIFPPYSRVNANGITIEVWVSQRKYPWMSFTDALVVPVAPDLKMVFGAAKIARDWGANRAQYEADQVAPLAPGEAFIGSGAPYRWHYTGLAVIFDNQKRTNPELLSAGLHNALSQLSAEGVNSVLIPDMTDNLIAQTNWITDEQRAETARKTARMMIDAILGAKGTVQTARIWVFDPRNADIYAEEMERLEAELNGETVPA